MKALVLLLGFLVEGLCSHNNDPQCITYIINDEMDELYQVDNELLRSMEMTTEILQPWNFNYNGKQIFTGGSLRLGLDSLYRTGDNTLTVCEGYVNKTILHFDYGLSFLNYAFPLLVSDGQAMSASVRVWKNSFCLDLTVEKSDGWCKLKFDGLEMKEAENVIMWSSIPEKDDRDVTEIFQNAIQPKLNDYFSDLLAYNYDENTPFPCEDFEIRRKKRSIDFDYNDNKDEKDHNAAADIGSGILDVVQNSVDTVFKVLKVKTPASINDLMKP